MTNFVSTVTYARLHYFLKRFTATCTLQFKRLEGLGLYPDFILKLLNGSIYLFIIYIAHIMFAWNIIVPFPQTLYEDIKSNHPE